MSARAATRAASNSKGLVLAILVDRNELSLRELVLCFISCKTFRELLDGRGFCIGPAWLCASLGSGQTPTEILSRLKSARESVAYERPLSRVDQVTSFLTRHEDYRVRWGWAWAQLLYQEPDGGVLCEGVKKMHEMLKHRLIKELHKSTGYLPGLCALKGHSSSVYSVAWSPDGKLVASGSMDNTIRIWEVAAGKEAMAPLTGHSGTVWSVAFSPDGELVASGGGDRTVRIWDVATGKEAMGPLTGHSHWVRSVAWSPDGKLVASGSSDGTIRIWDVAAGKEAIGPLTWHSHAVYSVAWSPDGKLVASCSLDKTVRIWVVATGKQAMGPLTGSFESWVDVGPEIRELAELVRQASQNLKACTGNYVVTADQDTVLIHQVVEGRGSGVEQGTEPVALFRCPSMVRAVACRPPYICAGCERGEVLFLDAPFLCEGQWSFGLLSYTRSEQGRNQTNTTTTALRTAKLPPPPPPPPTPPPPPPPPPRCL